MPIWLDPTGKSTYGIGICARSAKKMSLDDLYSDPNSPGLKVCLEDLDEYDPYRLPARRTEDIALRFTRPDEPLTAGGPIPNPISLFGIVTTPTQGPLGTTSGGLMIIIPQVTPF